MDIMLKIKFMEIYFSGGLYCPVSQIYFLFPLTMDEDIIIDNVYETGNLFLNFISSGYLLK